MDKLRDEVYAFLYNPCIYESSAQTISLHYSEQGAIDAMNIHKEEKKKEFDLLWGDEEDSHMIFGDMEAWFTQPVKILP